jgi:hypothetical protein
MRKTGKTWDDVAAHVGSPTRDIHRWRKQPGSPGDSKDLADWAAFALTRKRKDVTVMDQAQAPAATGTDAPLEPQTRKAVTTIVHDVFMRDRIAQARIKEARARKDEIANAKQAGELIDALLAAEWSARLLSSVRIEADGLSAHVDLMGLPPEIATPLRAAAVELARRFRNRIAALPELTKPPKPGEVA